MKLLYVHRFPLFKPHFLAEAEKINYNDQGKQIQAEQKALGLTLSQYIRQLSVEAGKLRKWEENQIRVSKRIGERLFRAQGD